MNRNIRFLSVMLLTICIFLITGCNKNRETDNIRSVGEITMARFSFPQNVNYKKPLMLPDNKTQQQIEDMIISLFKNILLNDLIIDTIAPQTKDDFRMVLRHSQSWEVNRGNIDVSHINVSESQGYGMLILAYMAGSEEKLNFSKDNWLFGSTGLKDYYDAMLRTVLAFPSITAPRLFTWELFGYPRDGNNQTGYKIVNGIKTAPFTLNTRSGSSATDGDMDIIYSLIIADRQWGSNGKHDYIGIARGMLADLWTYCVHDEYHTLLLGDWAKRSTSRILRDATRPSDFMTAHLKSYKEIDPDHDWQAVINATYNVIKEIRDSQNNAGNTNGLLPDFVIRGNTSWEIPVRNILESYDSDYAYNACRVPWRLGTDYLLFGDTQIGNFSLYEYIIKPIDEFAGGFSNGNMNRFGPLRMNGTSFSGPDPNLFTPPFLVTAAAVGYDQKWVNAFWDFPGLARYRADTYGDYIKLIVMITASGNYWLP